MENEINYMLQKAREIAADRPPEVYVMTDECFEALKQTTEVRIDPAKTPFDLTQMERDLDRGIIHCIPRRDLHAVPIEHYPTLEECNTRAVLLRFHGKSVAIVSR